MNALGALPDDMIIVDDDELTLELAKRRLRDSDIRLKCFNDEESALAYLRTHSSRVLMVDQRMPRMQGLEFLRRLSENTSFDMTRAYLCSTVELPKSICDAAREFGAHVLSKDVYRSKAGLLKLLDRH